MQKYSRRKVHALLSITKNKKLTTCPRLLSGKPQQRWGRLCINVRLILQNTYILNAQTASRFSNLTPATLKPDKQFCVSTVTIPLSAAPKNCLPPSSTSTNWLVKYKREKAWKKNWLKKYLFANGSKCLVRNSNKKFQRFNRVAPSGCFRKICKGWSTRFHKSP